MLYIVCCGRRCFNFNSVPRFVLVDASVGGGGYDSEVFLERKCHKDNNNNDVNALF